jgi:hypothetical protein
MIPEALNAQAVKVARRKQTLARPLRRNRDESLRFRVFDFATICDAFREEILLRSTVSVGPASGRIARDSQRERFDGYSRTFSCDFRCYGGRRAAHRRQANAN